MLYLSLSKLVTVSLNQVGDAGLPLLATNLAKESSWASSLLDKTVEGPGLLVGAWASKCHFKVSFDIPITLAARYTDAPCHTILLAFSMASAVYFFFSLPIFIPYLNSLTFIYLFIYLVFNVAFNTVQVISRWVVGKAQETSTYSWSRFCTVSYQPMPMTNGPKTGPWLHSGNTLRSGFGSRPDLRGGRRECYHCVTMALSYLYSTLQTNKSVL